MLTVTIGDYTAPFYLWTPATGRVFDTFAYDTETTEINDERPDLTPELVVATACNGEHGYFISREHILEFFEAHSDATIICHNAAFDLKVTQSRLGDCLDIYDSVENDKVWCTLVLKRLLSLATEGHTARGNASLADCVRDHLGIDLDKQLRDAKGRKVRTDFGRFLYKPFSTIPTVYRKYAAVDALVTWHLFWCLHDEIRKVLRQSQGVFGYVDDAWLRDEVERFGPLTHHVQLRASIVTAALTQNGIAIDNQRREQKVEYLTVVRDECLHRLQHEHGIQASGPGSSRSIQTVLDRFHTEQPDVPMNRTPKGDKWSTKKEDLEELAPEDVCFRDFVQFKSSDKLIGTYLSKMATPRLHPRFGFLATSGRTWCGDGYFNLQNLPKEDELLEQNPEAVTVRGCFVPPSGYVFVDVDYTQIELVVLAYVFKNQFQVESRLFDLIQADQDVHRLIAAAVLQKDPSGITKHERDGAKPVSFGRPGGMTALTLQKIAKKNYEQDLSLAEVEERIAAYHRLCPELDQFLDDEVDSGQVIADTLNLTPAEYNDATGGYYHPGDERAYVPQGWLGGMLLKVLRETNPHTQRGDGRPYTPEEIYFFWAKAQELSAFINPELVLQLQQQEANEDLWEAVRNWAGRRPVFTVTGRLRARASFCASRNGVFQGAAADGAILGMWKLWRAGYKLVASVHDQNVVEVIADDNVNRHRAEITRLMIEGMQMVVPGMNVKIKSVVSRSLNKTDIVAEYSDLQE